MFDDFFKELELNKEEYKQDIQISLNEINKCLEKTKFTVEEYALMNKDGMIKCTGNDLLETYRQYKEWIFEDKKIVFARIDKGIFMGEEWILETKVLKIIKE